MMTCENCDKMHWSCCIKPMLGGLLWLLAAVSLLLAWYTTAQEMVFWGKDAAHWYWDALVLGVLALGCKIHCGKGECGMCGTTKKT